MKISRKELHNARPAVQLPPPASFDLPEKVLQFGTGVLLRGLPDYFIDKANKEGLFNGRIVMVKSTSQGNIAGLRQQDNLYTLYARGVQNGKDVEEYYLNNSVSRILIANEQWNEIITCASSNDLQIIISNTTEVGIQLTDDDVHADPPQSFPGKLLAFLYARYQAFKGDKEKGMIIIPTELIVDNGYKLKQILVKLSHQNKLNEDFIQWLVLRNTFCNSLVDRIVPGKPDEEEKEKIEAKLGYEDDFLIKAEPYRLWAIETPDKRVNDILSFSVADKGVILTNDISKYRELKLRLLNGTHTFSCALAYLNGFDTVKEAVEDHRMGSFIQNLMNEIIQGITGEKVTTEEATSFAKEVLDRFRNPYIVHKWLSISLQYTSKMKLRNLPLLVAYYEKHHKAPANMAQGLAAYILFMRSERKADGSFWGTRQGKDYKINDDNAGILYHWWKQFPHNPVKAILADTDLWESDLTALPRLEEEVEKYLFQWMKEDFSPSLL